MKSQNIIYPHLRHSFSKTCNVMLSTLHFSLHDTIFPHLTNDGLGSTFTFNFRFFQAFNLF